MKRVSHYQAVQCDNDVSQVVTIGNFDGVHVGHRALLAAAREQADALGLSLAVLTFEPHPVEVLKPGSEKLRLVGPKRKEELLAECGVDIALFQRFDRGFAAMEIETFAREVLAKSLQARLVYVGENFRFGRGRGGNVRALTDFGRKLGFKVIAKPLIQLDNQVVSSSRIRELLSEGRAAEAATLLGRFHEVTGTVLPDQQLGKKMGFPTINLRDVAVMFPGAGIYAAFCDVGDRAYRAAAYIGDRPTLGTGFSIEAHLLDFEGELYQREVTLRFVQHIRDDRKFNSTRELTDQITDDIARIKQILSALS